MFGAIDVMLVAEDAAPLLILPNFDVLRGTYQMVMPGLGMVGSLIVPEKRLSR